MCVRVRVYVLEPVIAQMKKQRTIIMVQNVNGTRLSVTLKGQRGGRD